MSPENRNVEDIQWIARCARRLREQWPHADPTSLDETASELLDEVPLRALAPELAAVTRLRRGIPDEASRAEWLSGQERGADAA